ncbi:MAG TPA: MBL fold metallo-hydrolase [Rectinemataceae bacterium]|nr:MBL fold metallo-hydrolase [Rectinemataceae bacterium]
MADRIQETGRVAEGFYILNEGFVCSYLLDAGGSFVAFDAGMDPRRTSAELAKLGIDPAKVSQVFLTHSDRDHVGGVGAFPGAAVFLPKAELAMLDHTRPRFLGLLYNKPLRFDFETLDDDQEFVVGGATISCVSTPGHTAGSMSFLVNGSILIVGDELNLRKGRAVIDRHPISIDNALRKDSLRKLAGLGAVRILCAMHSGYTLDAEAALRGWKAF